MTLDTINDQDLKLGFHFAAQELGAHLDRYDDGPDWPAELWLAAANAIQAERRRRTEGGQAPELDFAELSDLDVRKATMLCDGLAKRPAGFRAVFQWLTAALFEERDRRRAEVERLEKMLRL